MGPASFVCDEAGISPPEGARNDRPGAGNVST